MLSSKTFWMLLIAVVLFVLKFFNPAFPLDATAIYTVVVFILSFFGIVPQIRAIGKFALTWGDLFSSMPFWVAVVALVSYVVHFYAPTFPLDETLLLALVVWLLNEVGINPTIAKVRKLLGE